VLYTSWWTGAKSKVLGLARHHHHHHGDPSLALSSLSCCLLLFRPQLSPQKFKGFSSFFFFM
jgi:hypothetical protein